MGYYRYNGKLTLNANFQITDAEFNHFKVNRLKNGEVIKIVDSENSIYSCQIIDFTKKSATIKTLSLENKASSSAVIVLYIGLVKEKALDFILQKSTELNVTNINLINCNFSNHKFSEAKMTRWQKIILEATKQSGRAETPKLFYFDSLELALTDAKNQNYDLILLDQEGKNIFAIKEQIKAPAALLIGPEGGLSPKEKALINASKINLGLYTLRSETAALAGLAVLRQIIS